MRFILLLALWLVVGSLGHTTETQDTPTISLYAPSQCQPCADWAAQLAAAGYMLDWQEKEPAALRKIERWLNVPSGYESLHVARVKGYFLAGPIPMHAIQCLITEKPSARGLVRAEGGSIHLVGHDGRVVATPWP